MRVKVSAGGDEKFGAWRSGDHDDLVLATALACWRARIRVPGVWGSGGWGDRFEKGGGREWTGIHANIESLCSLAR